MKESEEAHLGRGRALIFEKLMSGGKAAKCYSWGQARRGGLLQRVRGAWGSLEQVSEGSCRSWPGGWKRPHMGYWFKNRKGGALAPGHRALPT